MSPIFRRQDVITDNADDFKTKSKLDVDLEIASLKHPERYPLIMKRNALDVVTT